MLLPMLMLCCNKIFSHGNNQKKAVTVADILKKHLHGEEPANFICFTFFW